MTGEEEKSYSDKMKDGGQGFPPLLKQLFKAS